MHKAVQRLLLSSLRIANIRLNSVAVPQSLEIQEGDSEDTALLGGWKKSSSISLEECNSTMPVPSLDAPWYKQWSAYIGVGFMVAVG